MRLLLVGALFLSTCYAADKNDKALRLVAKEMAKREKEEQKRQAKIKKELARKEKEAREKKHTLPLEKGRAEDLIKEVYKGITGFGLRQDENAMISTKGGNATYGEITFASLQLLINDLNLTKSDTFYDLGSGVGKACIQVGLVTPAKAIGVEISPTRVKKAREALNRLKKDHKIKIDDKIQFKEGDVANENIKPSAVVFACSTCFSEKLLNVLVEKFKKTPGRVRVLSLKVLPGLSPEKVYQLPMSWTAAAAVYYYIFNNDK